MYPNGRFFPPEYYRVTKANSVKIRGRWFVNRPISPDLPMSPQNIEQQNESEDLMVSPPISKINSISPQNNDNQLVQNAAVLPVIIDTSKNSKNQEESVQNSTVTSSDENTNSIEDTTLSVMENRCYIDHLPENESDMLDGDSDDSIKDPDFELSDQSNGRETDFDEDCNNKSARNLNLNSESGKSLTISDFDKENNTLSLGISHTDQNFSEILTLDKNTSLCDFQVAKYKNDGQRRKGNKGKDFCYFCEIGVLNFARHIQRNHSGLIEVQRVLSLPKNSKERKKQLALLRNKGNFLLSNVKPKPVKQAPQPTTTLLPCTSCLGFYSSKQLWRHRKNCVGVSGGKNIQGEAQNFLCKNIRVDPKFAQTVLNKMRADNISLVVKKDVLICAFGSRYIQKNRSKHLVSVASVKMRELAKLLIEVRKSEPAVTDLFSSLKPQYYDHLVDATKIVAKYDNENEYYKTPTYAMNIATTLKQCCDIALNFVLKRKEVYATIPAAEAEADIKTLRQLIESEWNYDVSSRAAADLTMKKWNKVTLVPLASDLKLLKDFLISKGNDAAAALQNNNIDQTAYKTLVETVFCRIMLLNRRRPGELQRLPLYLYENLDCQNQSYEEFSEVVTPSEKVLMQKFKRIVVRGKRGRGVPVLFSLDVQQHIKILMEHRNNFLGKENIYLFGNPNTNEPICGYKVLKKYATSCGAKNPDAITATKLRKHLATLTQVLSMTENDIEQLASFMGHTVGVHKGSYRLPDDVYQTAKISKLLILMEKGAAAQFKGKSLNEIDLDLNDNLLESEELNPGEEEEKEPYETLDAEMTKNTELEKKKEDLRKNNNEKQTKKRLIVPWTEKQKKVVETFFADHIKKKMAPKKVECFELKERNEELLNNKDWLKIKVYVQNKYTKKLK